MRSIRAALAAVVLVGAFAPLGRAAEAFRPGGPVGPEGNRATADIPASRHIRNTGGSDGLGLCVFTSCQLAADWQHVRELDGFRAWMERRPGGGYPEKLDSCIKKFCAEKGVTPPEYLQHTGGDVAFLEAALKTGRMPCVTYAGSDDFYRGGIDHMVNLVYLDGTSACIIDNNRPGVFLWMSRAEYLTRWRARGGGWAVAFLNPPPPPHPSATPPGVHVVGQLGPVPVGDPPGDGFEWRQLAGVGWGWVQTRPPAGTNYGIERDKLPSSPHYTRCGQEVTREDAHRALAGDGLTDDSDRYHLVGVGDGAFEAAFKAAVEKLPPADRGRVLVNAYAPGEWQVGAFELSPGVTLRKPARNRVGADCGHAAAADQVGAIVAAELRPSAPTPGPGLPDLGGWGNVLTVLLALAAGIAGPKVGPLITRIGPAVVALVVALVGYFRRPSAPTPGPEPAPAPGPDGPRFPLAWELLKLVALRRFPWLAADEAVHRLATDLVAAETAPPPAAPTDPPPATTPTP